MKTKQVKEDQDKGIDDEVIEPKTRARKKASDAIDEDRNKTSHDEPKTSKESKRILNKPKAIVKKKPLGIRKTLRSKKVAIAKEKAKRAIKQTVTRARKAAIKSEPDNSQEKDTVQLIPASDIKKEPVDDTPNSRSSSPKTAGRRQRLSSDLIMMKTMLGDSPSSLVLGPRTSPYSMRSERSNSPSLFEGKNLRSGKPRKVKSNLLNEVVMKEQKKRRRLLSDSKTADAADPGEDCKKMKRGRSCSRDGSEISKCSENTESDLSLSEPLNDTDSSKELNKNLEKSKTDLDVDIENNVQISTLQKVPSINDKSSENKQDAESSSIVNKSHKKKLSLKRSPSLDSDNNNSNRIKLAHVDVSDIENKLLMKTDDDTLLKNRSSILSCMSKTFNSREMSKNIRKARRGRKAAAASRPDPNKVCISNTITNNTNEDKQETLESLSKEIDDLINNLDQNINRDHELATETPADNSTDVMQVKQVSKFYGAPKQLNNDENVIVSTSNTPVKRTDVCIENSNESTPSKIDDSETIRLHYEEDPVEKTLDASRHEITYKCTSVASIDKLMDRLKEFEEFDKRRHRQESETTVTDGKPMMVTNDVVLIPKSGADIKPLKDIQAVRSPEKPIEKENVLSCFENNSAISIVKRDQVRKSIDIDLPNSVTLIKRNSLTTRKESISSNHSRESDAISIFEKSLGKDVTLTEIRKSVDKSVSTQVDLHLFATLHPNNPTHNLVGGVVLDANEISITPRVINESKLVINDKQNIPKVKSSEPLSRKSSESTNEEDKTVIIEKIKSPTHQNISQAISITSTPVAVKSPESLPMETEALPPPIENIKPEDISLSSGVSKCGTIKDTVRSEITVTNEYIKTKTSLSDENIAEILNMEDKSEDNAMDINNKENTQIEVEMKAKITKQSRSARCSIKSLPETDSIAVVECKVNNKQESKIIESVSQKDLVDISTEKISNTKIEEIQAQRRNSCSNTETKPKEYALRNYVSESKPDIPNEVDGRPARKSKSAKSTETQQEPSTPTDDIKKRKEFVLRQLGMLGKDENKDSTRTSTSGDLTNNVKEDKYNDLEKNHKEIVQPSMIKGDNEVKPSKSPKITRMDSQPGPSNVFNETPETKKHKEYVLRTLGLLTHKAAKEAKIEKLKEKERIYGANLTGMIKSKAAKSGSGDYTGTLKTVIKLNRGTGDRDKKKQRSSLKMTFQKSKYRSGKPTPEIGDAANEDEAYYTIERREGVTGAASDGGHRKSHYSNRLTNHVDAEAVPEPTEPKETLNLVIPEKASSFSIHPGRLCMDQCFYCGGKFGLFDTPCHIAQIKSSERQKKILDNEEKLTIDSCLCDACYRHVDRRANCPSYRKRPQGRHVDAPPLPSLTALPSPTSTAAELDFKVATYGQTNISKSWQTEKPVSPTLDEESEEEPPAPAVVSGRMATCHTEGCMGAADYSIRRKWLIKMRSSVNKVLKLKCDYPGLHTIPLCGDHYRTLAPLMACVLCRRRITKHHNVHFIHHGYLELNPLLCGAGVPVQFSERPVVCNACRNYCTLLQRLGHNHQSARAYRRKLLQIYNIEVPPESDNEGEENMTQEEAAASKQKKKQRAKSKQRKSTEPEQTSESSEKTNESTPEKEKNDDNDLKDAMRDEEDIESLISSNKILVPGATKTNEPMMHSDGSEAENVCEYDTPFIHIDKQTELQYLLQKQNNPAQFLQKPPNLSQKHRNIMKIQAVAGVQKPAQIHRIIDKNAKRIHKIGQIITQKPQDKVIRHELEEERSREGVPILKNINLNDECTIETIPNKRSADINTLRNKWQMSESFTQVKKNLSELSKKFPEKESKKASDAKYSNPVKRLETNPSISVRELFPGEEEMNLQCNIEFNNVKGVTPEGWEKCNTMIQYDVETKKLWTELQRPYGNQSSFLRHLILLEKYFRSGDLILSHNASPHAVNYSDSVQSRLRSYDNIPDPPRRNDPPISLIEFRKKPSMNGKSLLKSNQNDKEKDPKKFMPPPMVPKPKTVKEKSKPKPLPPELIAINTPNAQGRKAIQNVLHNIQQLVKGVSASDPTEVAAAPLVPPKYDPPKEKKEAVKTDTPKKTKPTSKPWRPTLMPITPENLAKIAREPTQVAVDGRNLPSLVQVMSSGKRYHITLQDYNKMCIMRREKLQQLQDSDKKRHSTEEGTVVTEIQPSAMLGNGGTVLQNITEDKQRDVDLGQMGNAATILKNVGLKNITIAPIPAKTATVTSSTMASSTTVTTPSLLVTTPIKIPQLGPAVSITSETILNPNVSVVSSQMVMPKIPKSLTVIPQSVATVATVASVAQPAPTTATTTQSLLTTADGTRP